MTGVGWAAVWYGARTEIFMPKYFSSKIKRQTSDLCERRREKKIEKKIERERKKDRGGGGEGRRGGSCINYFLLLSYKIINIETIT